MLSCKWKIRLSLYSDITSNGTGPSVEIEDVDLSFFLLKIRYAYFLRAFVLFRKAIYYKSKFTSHVFWSPDERTLKIKFIPYHTCNLRDVYYRAMQSKCFANRKCTHLLLIALFISMVVVRLMVNLATCCPRNKVRENDKEGKKNRRKLLTQSDEKLF